jgi:hypothetical protein
MSVTRFLQLLGIHIDEARQQDVIASCTSAETTRTDLEGLRTGATPGSRRGGGRYSVGELRNVDRTRRSSGDRFVRWSEPSCVQRLIHLSCISADDGIASRGKHQAPWPAHP